MSTKPKDMGELPETNIKPRDMGNIAQHVRDDGSLLILQVISDLEKITTNEVNDEEGVERIAAQAVSDLNVFVRALEKVGAKTAPHYELEARLRKSGVSLTPATV